MRWLIVCFWAFVGFMLLKQFIEYNEKVERQVIENSRTAHYSSPFAAGPPSATSATQGADVRQVSYMVKPDTPSPGNFTVIFVVKNVGNTKAKGVQIHVRPYRGIMLGDAEEGGSVPYHRLPENDPLSLFGQWVALPDLGPGESSSQSLVFVSQQGATPGLNPHPEIDFETEKANP